jgi:hypothetical protein
LIADVFAACWIQFRGNKTPNDDPKCSAPKHAKKLSPWNPQYVAFSHKKISLKPAIFEIPLKPPICRYHAAFLTGGCRLFYFIYLLDWI